MRNGPTNRRKVMVATIGGALFLGHPSARASMPPPPPKPTLEDRVREADLIFVGVIERFVFRGYDLLILRDEYNKDFPEDNGIGNRELDAFVRVAQILKNDLKFELPQVLRVGSPVPREAHQSHLGLKEIFLLQKGRLLHVGNPEIRLYRPVMDALPIQLEGTVRQAIDQINARNKR